MGLFEKRVCSVCGMDAGRVFHCKLAGDAVICKSCRERCTPGLTEKQMKHMNVAQIRENMQIAADNRSLYVSRFEVTKKFMTGVKRNKPMLYADESHGWFIDARSKEPYVYRLTDITDCFLDLKTSSIINEEKKREQGYLEWLHNPDFYTDFPEQPRCPEGRKISSMTFIIELADNELDVSRLSFDVNPGIFADMRDIRSAYELSHELYQFLQYYKRTGDRNRQMEIPEHTSASEGMTDKAGQLKKLKEVYEMGLLTDEEYAEKKKQLFERLK